MGTQHAIRPVEILNKFSYCPMCAEPLVERNVNRIECSAACGFANYDNPTPVPTIVVEYNGKIVFGHNSSCQRDFLRNYYHFVDHRESPVDFAVREVKEELNLDAGPPTLIDVYPFEQLNEELDRYKLVAPRECAAWPTGTGYALRDWLRAQGIEPGMIKLR